LFFFLLTAFASINKSLFTFLSGTVVATRRTRPRISLKSLSEATGLWSMIKKEIAFPSDHHLYANRFPKSRCINQGETS
ncbi:unnamed protein product, partial [Musa banksii]